MAVSAITADTVNSATKAAGLSLEDLLKVLLTELTYQDPMKPVDNKDFLAQMAQFSSLDTTRQLNENITSLLSVQSLNQSASLLGKTVDAISASGLSVSGEITAVTMVAGQPQLTLTGDDTQVFSGITLSQIQTIR